MTTAILLRSRLAVLIAALMFAGPFLSVSAAQTGDTADLAITMSSNKKDLRYQQKMKITIVVTNLGPDTATGVTIATGESDSINPGPIRCADRTVVQVWEICPGITLAPGESATYTWTVTACCSCCPEMLGITTASVQDDDTTIDPNVGNDLAQLETPFRGTFPRAARRGELARGASLLRRRRREERLPG